MAYKYKLKEIKIGDTKINNGVKSTVTNIDPETGAISWSVNYIPNLSRLVEDSMELVTTAKGVYQKAKDDKKLLDIYEQARQLRNVIRTHVRNNYPEDYKKAIREEEVDVVDLAPTTQVKAKNYIQDPKTYADTIIDISNEILDQEADSIARNPQVKQVLRILKQLSNAVKETSMSGAAGAYNTPYAFVRKKLQPGKKKKKKKSKYKMKMPSGMVSSLGYTMGEGKLGDGADLGPGPKAGPDGVTDSAYTKQFKYKLVPKNKDGTYVQKGAGMIVKKLY